MQIIPLIFVWTVCIADFLIVALLLRIISPEGEWMKNENPCLPIEKKKAFNDRIRRGDTLSIWKEKTGVPLKLKDIGKMAWLMIWKLLTQYDLFSEIP